MLNEKEIISGEVLENKNDSLVIKWNNNEVRDNILSKELVPNSFNSAKFGDTIYAKIKNIVSDKIELYDLFLSRRIKR